MQHKDLEGQLFSIHLSQLFHNCGSSQRWVGSVVLFHSENLKLSASIQSVAKAVRLPSCLSSINRLPSPQNEVVVNSHWIRYKESNKQSISAFHSFLIFSVFSLVCCPCPACSFIKACTVRPIFSVAILPPSINLQQLKRLQFCRAFRIHHSHLCGYAVPGLNDKFVQHQPSHRRLWC